MCSEASMIFAVQNCHRPLCLQLMNWKVSRVYGFPGGSYLTVSSPLVIQLSYDGPVTYVLLASCLNNKHNNFWGHFHF